MLTPTTDRESDITASIQHSIRELDLGSPAVSNLNGIHAGVADNAGTQVINTGFSQPDIPRTIILTPSGTTANVTATTCDITGTDASGAVLTETTAPFSAGAATAVETVNAFATITSITQRTTGTAVTINYGLGTSLGLGVKLSRDTVISLFQNGVRITRTNVTVAFDAANLARNIIKSTTAFAGTAVIVDFYEPAFF